MKRQLLYLGALLIMSVATEASAQTLNKKLSAYQHFLGTFELEIYFPDPAGKFAKVGTGKATIGTALDGTFLQEEKATKVGQGGLTMLNIIGIDPRTGGFRLFAMDKEFGTMDIYLGKADGKNLVFDNVKSDAKFVNQNGSSLSFRLTYTFESVDRNILVVESTEDEGTTWKPYARAVYNRVK